MSGNMRSFINLTCIGICLCFSTAALSNCGLVKSKTHNGTAKWESGESDCQKDTSVNGFGVFATNNTQPAVLPVSQQTYLSHKEGFQPYDSYTLFSGTSPPH